MAAIQEDVPAPTGFLKSRAQVKSEFKVFFSSAAPEASARHVVNQDKSQPERAPEVTGSERRFDAFWETLSERERGQFEQEAVATEAGFDQRFYMDGKGREPL